MTNLTNLFIRALAGLVVLSCTPLAFGSIYNGNGNTDFGGAVGNGSLTLSDDGTTLSGTITRGAGGFNDVLVIYIDSVAGGFANTSGFADGNDGLRRAISGFDGGANRSTLTFESGFSPDYAIALGPSSDNFGGLWQLANGGGNSLNYVNGVNLNPTGTANSSSYTFSISIASLGLTPNSGQSFDFFGTYIGNSGYRSGEAIGGVSGSAGWNPFSQTSFNTYTITAVPEPITLALPIFGGLVLATGLARRFVFRRTDSAR